MIIRSKFQKHLDYMYRRFFGWSKRIKFTYNMYEYQSFYFSDLYIFPVWQNVKTYSLISSNANLFRADASVFAVEIRSDNVDVLMSDIIIHNKDELRKRRIELACDLKTKKLNNQLKKGGLQ